MYYWQLGKQFIYCLSRVLLPHLFPPCPVCEKEEGELPSCFSTFILSPIEGRPPRRGLPGWVACAGEDLLTVLLAARDTFPPGINRFGLPPTSRFPKALRTPCWKFNINPMSFEYPILPVAEPLNQKPRKRFTRNTVLK